MAIQLNPIIIASDLVSNLVTKCNDHMDVTADIISRITGDTGTKSIKQNVSGNLAAGTNAFVVGSNNKLNSGSDNSAIIGGANNVIDANVDNVVVIGGQNLTATTSTVQGILTDSISLNTTVYFKNTDYFGFGTLDAGLCDISTGAYFDPQATPVFLTAQIPSGTTGHLFIDNTASGFGTVRVQSSSILDYSTFAWFIVRG